MYPGFLATALSDRRDSAILLYLGSVVESIPVLPEGGAESGCKDDTGPWQGSEQRVVGQRGYELCDGLVETPDEFEGGPELFDKSQGFQRTGMDDGGIIGQCGRCLDRRYACFDDIRTSYTVFLEETLQGTSPGPFDLFEGGPTGDKRTEDKSSSRMENAVQPDAEMTGIRLLHTVWLLRLCDSVADVQLVHGIVGESAGAGADLGTAHLVLALGKCTAGSIGARNAAPLVVGNPRCLADQGFALVIERETALARHHVRHLTCEHAGLVGEIIDRVELHVERHRHRPAGESHRSAGCAPR